MFFYILCFGFFSSCEVTCILCDFFFIWGVQNSTSLFFAFPYTLQISFFINKTTYIHQNNQKNILKFMQSLLFKGILKTVLTIQIVTRCPPSGLLDEKCLKKLTCGGYAQTSNPLFALIIQVYQFNFVTNPPSWPASTSPSSFHSKISTFFCVGGTEKTCLFSLFFRTFFLMLTQMFETFCIPWDKD